LISLVNHKLTGKTDSCYRDFLTKICQRKKYISGEQKYMLVSPKIRTDMTESQSKHLVLLKCYSVCLLHTLSHSHTQLLEFSHTGFCFTRRLTHSNSAS